MLKQIKQKYEIIDNLDGGKRTQLCESLNVATNLLKLCADKNRYEIRQVSVNHKVPEPSVQSVPFVKQPRFSPKPRPVSRVGCQVKREGNTL
jgi:hypothetical protein